MCSVMTTSVLGASQLLIPNLAKAPWLNCLVAHSVKTTELTGVQANFKIICMVLLLCKEVIVINFFITGKTYLFVCMCIIVYMPRAALFV